MKEVYNKTLVKLFKGTKNLTNNNAGDEVMEEDTTLENIPRDKDSYKQLTLSSTSGKLCILNKPS